MTPLDNGHDLVSRFPEDGEADGSAEGARGALRRDAHDAAHILVVDNYDSFVYTIVSYLRTLGAVVDVLRNDAIAVVGCDIVPAETNSDSSAFAKNSDFSGDGDGAFRTRDVEHVSFADYDGVLISPGPGAPANAGVSEDMIRLCARTGTPMLGVCLGLQALAEVYGASVTHAASIRHGKTSDIELLGVNGRSCSYRGDEASPTEDLGGSAEVKGTVQSMFEGVPNPFVATRYHSLAVDPHTLPNELEVTARAMDDDTVQALQHVALPLYGVQFHPESIMSGSGYRIFANWLGICGQSSAVGRSYGLMPRVPAMSR